MEGYSEFALSDEEKARGLILACRAVPWADCEVAWLEEDDLIVHPRRLLDCRVVGLDDATHDIKRIRLDDRVGRAVRLLGRPVRLGDLRRAARRATTRWPTCRATRCSSSMSAARSGGATSAYVARQAEARRQRAGRGAVRRLLPAREPSRADHRRRRRLGHGADQVDRRAGAAPGAAPAHLFLFRRPHRARPLSARPFRRSGQEARHPALHAGAERGHGGGHAAPAWCTRRSPPTSTSSTAARPTSPARRSWSRRRPCCSSSAACGASISMPTPSTPPPKWPGPAGKRERNYDGTVGRTGRHRHRRRPRHRPRHRRIAGGRGRERHRRR